MAPKPEPLIVKATSNNRGEGDTDYADFDYFHLTSEILNVTADYWAASPVSALLGVPVKVINWPEATGIESHNYVSDLLFIETDLASPKFGVGLTRTFRTDVLIARCDGESLVPEHVQFLSRYIHDATYVLKRSEFKEMQEGPAKQRVRKTVMSRLNAQDFVKTFDKHRVERLAVGEDIWEAVECPVKLSCQNAEKCCAACGAVPSDEKPLLVCSICKARHYCNRECQTKDWKQHKKTCGKKIPSDERVPCVFTSPGAFQNGPKAVGHTEGTYPKHLLNGTNVIPSKVSELLGTPLLIIKNPIKKPDILDFTKGSHISAQREHSHASELMIETDPESPRFCFPAETIGGDVAFVRKDGKHLDWRLVEYIAMYIEVELRYRVQGLVAPNSGMSLEESAVASMSKGPFRGMFEEAGEMLAGDSWATEAWKEKVGDDFF